MSAAYFQKTPRQHIVDTITSRIKCGRATDIHAAIEGFISENADSARAGHNSVGASIYNWYIGSTYEQRERLIKEIERHIVSR